MSARDELDTQREKIFVRALDVASAYDLHAARKVLEDDLKGTVLEHTPLLVQLAPRKMVAVFDYGSIVFFNVESREQTSLVQSLMPVNKRPSKTVRNGYFP